MKKPTFLLKPSAYKTNELYSIIPTDGNGDMNVSGYVGNGTRVNSQGIIVDVATDTPRIDYHNGVGLLLEPTRTNFFTYSEDVSSWTSSTATVTSNDALAPDGKLTADKVTDANAATALYSRHSKAVTDSTAIHTVSCFIKFGDTNNVGIIVDTATSASTLLTVSSDGSIVVDSDSGSRVVSSGYEKYNDGWIRFYFIYDMLDADSGIDIYIYPGGHSDVDEIGYCWVWGIQCEEGSFMTSYIPTSASTVTRTAETLTMTNTITNGMVSAGNGALYVEVSTPDLSIRDTSGNVLILGGGGGGLYIKGDGTTTNSFAIYIDDTASSTTVDYSTRTRSKILINFSPTNIEIWLDGTKVRSRDTDFYLISESLTVSGVPMASKIHEIALFNTKLTDTEAQAITQ